MAGVGTPALDRVRSTLDCVAVEKLGVQFCQQNSFEAMRNKLQNVFCDISQSPSFRRFTSERGVTGCLTTSTRLYSLR